MVSPKAQNGYVLTESGLELAFDFQLGRDETWTLTFRRIVDDRNEDFSSGGPWTISYAIAPHPGDTATKTGTLTVSDGDSGEADLALADTDFSALTWDLGEKLKVLSIDFVVDDSTSKRPCFDGRGRASFPFRVHRVTS